MTLNMCDLMQQTYALGQHLKLNMYIHTDNGNNKDALVKPTIGILHFHSLILRNLQFKLSISFQTPYIVVEIEVSVYV